MLCLSTRGLANEWSRRPGRPGWILHKEPVRSVFRFGLWVRIGIVEVHYVQDHVKRDNSCLIKARPSRPLRKYMLPIVSYEHTVPNCSEEHGRSLTVAIFSYSYKVS